MQETLKQNQDGVTLAALARSLFGGELLMQSNCSSALSRLTKAVEDVDSSRLLVAPLQVQEQPLEMSSRDRPARSATCKANPDPGEVCALRLDYLLKPTLCRLPCVGGCILTTGRIEFCRGPRRNP